MARLFSDQSKDEITRPSVAGKGRLFADDITSVSGKSKGRLFSDEDSTASTRPVSKLDAAVAIAKHEVGKRVDTVTSIPGGLEGLVKGAAGFAVGGSVAAVRGTIESVLGGDANQYASTFNDTMARVGAAKIPFTGLHWFEADSDSGKVVQETVGNWFLKGGEFFDRWAKEGLDKEALSAAQRGEDPTVAVPSAIGRRLLGEAAMLMATVFGVRALKGGYSLAKSSLIKDLPTAPAEQTGLTYTGKTSTNLVSDGTIDYEPSGSLYKELIKSVRDIHPELSHKSVVSTWQFLQDNYARISKNPIIDPKDAIPFSLEILPYEMFRSLQGINPKTRLPFGEVSLKKKYIDYIDAIEDNYVKAGGPEFTKSLPESIVQKLVPSYKSTVPTRYAPTFDLAQQKWLRLQEMAQVVKEIKKNPNVDLTNRNRTAANLTDLYKENITEGAMREFDLASKEVDTVLEEAYKKNPEQFKYEGGMEFPEQAGSILNKQPATYTPDTSGTLDIVRAIRSGAKGVLDLKAAEKGVDEGLMDLYKRLSKNRIEPKGEKGGKLTGKKDIQIKKDPKTGDVLVDNVGRPFVESFLEGVAGKAITAIRVSGKNATESMKRLVDRMYPPELANGKMLEGETSYPVQRAQYLGKHMSALNDIFKAHLPRLLPYLKNSRLPFARRGTVVGGANNMKLWRYLVGKPLSGTPRQITELGNNLRVLLNNVHLYAADVLPLKHIQDYFPIVWDFKKISKLPDQFRDEVLIKQGIDPTVAQEIVDNIIYNKGSYKFNPERPSTMSQYKAVALGDTSWATKSTHADFMRKFKNFDYTEAEGWLDTNVHRTLSKYIEDVVERVEFARQFGPNLEKAHTLVAQSVKERFAKHLTNKKEFDKMHMYEIERVYDLLDGIQGVYGKKQFAFGQKVAVSFLNFALLPFATIASLPEMALPLHRAGIRAYSKALGVTGANVFVNLSRTIWRDAFKGLDKTRQMELLESIGKSLDITAMERQNQLYAGDFTWASNVFFKANGLHYWTKFMNTLAVSSYDYMMRDYLAGRIKGKIDPQMETYMEHYGINAEKGMEWIRNGAKLDDPFAEQFKGGAFKFAEEVVLTPNPANVPMWHSNPRWTIFRHLKTFPTLMVNTVLRGWGQSVKQSWETDSKLSMIKAPMNVVSVGTYMLGLAIVSNSLKDLLRYGDLESNVMLNRYSDKSTLERAVLRAVDGSMILGPGQMAVDSWMYAGISSPITSLAGPGFAKSDSMLRALKSGNARAVAREMAKLTPVLAQHKSSREAITDELTDFLDSFTWLEKSSTGGRQARRAR